MATLTSTVSIASTDLVYRGSATDRPFTGSVVLRSIDVDCDGSIILYWEGGKLVGQFHSTLRTLDLISDQSKLTYSADKQTVVQDNSPIRLKPGNYYARFYPGHSAYYAHAAIRSSCGCGWCAEPCDRIWKVGGSTIQGIHESEKRIPEYEYWIPMAYYLGVYGDSYSDAVQKGKTSPVVDNSAMFASTKTKTPVKPLSELLGTSRGSSGGGGGGTNASGTVSDVPAGLEFLDLSSVDFCSENNCDSGAKANTKGPSDCEGCKGKCNCKGNCKGNCNCK